MFEIISFQPYHRLSLELVKVKLLLDQFIGLLFFEEIKVSQIIFVLIIDLGHLTKEFNELVITEVHVDGKAIVKE